MTDVALVQFKPRKGEYAANLAALGAIFAQVRRAPVDLIVLPEAALTGYFLEGAVYELALEAPAFARDLDRLWRAGGPGEVDVVCGFFENDGGTFYNSALYARLGGDGPEIVHVHRKLFLPTYGVFDEERFHTRGRKLGVFESAFGPSAILICEDAWHSISATVAALKGARLIIVPSASPGRGLGAGSELENVVHWKCVLATIAQEHGVYVLYAGLTGFEGGKGMSGSSCALSPRGELLCEAPALGECVLRLRLDPVEVDVARATLPLLGDLQSALPDLWFDPELPLPRAARESVES
ncbi:MAG: nitrilase-related carbon-nitrogen hydrolase [Candidatus Velthaea sp.]|jgi:predicted amidohydrolase